MVRRPRRPRRSARLCCTGHCGPAFFPVSTSALLARVRVVTRAPERTVAQGCMPIFCDDRSNGRDGRQARTTSGDPRADDVSIGCRFHEFHPSWPHKLKR
ncbi:hypothetical protein Rhow_004728 [Rhodococcus wratislaviensis]|uniref:Uncharacterized protein n=1 Tax=Rhodococcus wratislaviensis TaxID=44752 RepID=A0A402CBU1_RHOWR|nr:hypothetical protein Rhow_004728 [Rhodococcus wratislaviensis]